MRTNSVKEDTFLLEPEKPKVKIHLKDPDGPRRKEPQPKRPPTPIRHVESEEEEEDEEEEPEEVVPDKNKVSVFIPRVILLF